MAVVGVGSLGQHHANKLAGFDDVDLIGVVDPGESAGRTVAERLDTNWFPTTNELPSEIDGVVIATPTCYHLESAAQFLTAGIPTFVEKPLASNVADATTLKKMAELTSTTLQVGHIERFNPAFEIAAERCGTPLYIRAQRVSPYSFRSTDIGVVHDLMIHDIDLVLSMAGGMPDGVEAFGAVGIGPHEDMAVARLRMAGGTIVDLTASRMCPTAERTLQIWGTNGCVMADLHRRTVQHWQPQGKFADNPQLVHAIAASTPDPRTLKDSVFGEWIQAETIQAADGDAMEMELRDFIAAIQTGSTPKVTASDAVNAMQVAEQVIDSLNLWSYQTNSAAIKQSRAA